MNNNQLHFLLVHGAWHGSWVWKEVAGSLLEKGFKVSCPTLTGLGERKHLISKNITIDTCITDVENHILYNDIKNIILVGHGFSGNVVSGIAEKYKDRIKQLIYFDSMLVEGGQTPFDITNSKITKERIMDEISLLVYINIFLRYKNIKLIYRSNFIYTIFFFIYFCSFKHNVFSWLILVY